MINRGIMGIAYKNKWTENYIFTLDFNRFIEYLDYLFPPSEEEKTVEQKKQESMDYFKKRKKTFSDIMGRVKRMKEEKGVDS